MRSYIVFSAFSASLILAACTFPRSGKFDDSQAGNGGAGAAGAQGPGGQGGVAPGGAGPGGGGQGGTAGSGGSPPGCGNGTIEPGEDCDDQNDDNDDDCINCKAAECGDGFHNTQGIKTEECDAIMSGAEGCIGCVVQPGWECQGDECSPICGDGVILGDEECDGGDLTLGDGCDTNCEIEDFSCCIGEPSVCVVGPELMVQSNVVQPDIPNGGLLVNPPQASCATFNVPDFGCNTMTDLNVELAVNHTYVGDLRSIVQAPSQTIAMLFDRPGAPASSDGDGSDLSSNFPILFDDEAATSSELMGDDLFGGTICEDSPSECTYFPTPDSLSTLEASTPHGTWTVCVGDANDNDRTGDFQSLRLLFSVPQ